MFGRVSEATATSAVRQSAAPRGMEKWVTSVPLGCQQHIKDRETGAYCRPALLHMVR